MGLNDMHELSIAYELVNSAVAAAEDVGGTKVNTVYLRLGALSGVVKDALLFGFEIAAQGTLLEGAQLVVEETPVVVHCEACAKDVTLASIQHFVCPACGAPTARVVQGREIELRSLEVETDDDDPPGR